MKTLKFNKEIQQLQERVNEAAHPSQQKRHLKETKEICEKCFKPYIEPAIPESITIDGDTIIPEFVPLCPSCFKKSLHTERERQFIIGAIGEGIIKESEYKNWKFGQKHKDNLFYKTPSSKEFMEKISYGVRKLKRKNVLSDVAVKCENFLLTKKFKRECEKYGITQKEIVLMANQKIRKIVENEDEKFLEGK